MDLFIPPLPSTPLPPPPPIQAKPKMNEQQPSSSTENPSLFSNLPPELIVQILLRLSVQSLLRLKSVCKLWRSLISDPKFAKSHFDLAASPTHRMFLYKSNDFIRSLDTNSSSRAVVKLEFPLAPPPPRVSRFGPSSARNFRVLCSCRGFVLLANDHSIVVWNPSTGVRTRIPESFGDLEFLYGFGYDQSRDDYLVVFIESNELVVSHCQPQIKVFSFKANSSFLFGVNAEYVDLGFDFRPGLLLNESLHWLVRSRITKLRVVLAFDLIHRNLLEIALPHDLAEELSNYTKEYYLRVLKECLYLCYSLPGGVTEIWMMNEYKVQSSWTKIVWSPYNILRNSFFPICFNKRGDVFGSDESGSLLKFNDRGTLVLNRPFYLSGSPLHTRMYTESLLSLPDPEIVSEYHPRQYYPPLSGFEEESHADGQHPGGLDQVNEDDQQANEEDQRPINFEEEMADGQHPGDLDQVIEDSQQANEDDQQPIYFDEAIVDDQQ